MKKYSKFAQLSHKNNKYIKIDGNYLEEVVHFNYRYKNIKSDFTILCMGITYPDKDYRISRIKTGVTYVLEYVLEGEGYVLIDDEIKKVEKGDTYLLSPDKEHLYYSSKDNPFKKIWVNFAGPLADSLFKVFSLKHDIYKNLDLKDDFDDLFKLEAISKNEDIIYPLSTKIITGMFAKIKQHINKFDQFDYSIENQIIQYFINNYNDDLHLDYISEKFNVSKSKIIYIFKNKFNLTPHQFLINKRIEKAKLLLNSPMYSIKDIADMVGFNDSNNLIKTFKRMVGKTPEKYRKDKIIIND